MTSRPRNATPKPPLPIYPAHCHSLSPTANKWCPLTATAVYNLVQFPGFEGQHIYHHTNHPVKWIQLTGVIVAIEQFSNRMVYTLDDSSGATIECKCLIEPPLLPPDPNLNYSSISGLPITRATRISPDGLDLTHIDLGSVVKFKGEIGMFRETRDLQIKRMVEIKDTNEEVRAWKERERFRRDVLGNVWVVTAEEEKKCLEAAETERKVLKEEERRRLRAQRKQNQIRKEKGKEGQEVRKKDRQEKRPQGKNKTSLLSMAARCRAAGKFDALGI